MTRLRSNCRPVALAAAIAITACGARVRPPEPAPDVGCDALFDLGPRPDHAMLAPVWTALDAGAWDEALAAGDRLYAHVVDQALDRFQRGDVDAADRRAFFREWVFVAPPVLVVDVDRFRFTPSVGGPLVAAAERAGDGARARSWLRATAFDELVAHRARACAERAGT